MCLSCANLSSLQALASFGRTLRAWWGWVCMRIYLSVNGRLEAWNHSLCCPTFFRRNNQNLGNHFMNSLHSGDPFSRRTMLRLDRKHKKAVRQHDRNKNNKHRSSLHHRRSEAKGSRLSSPEPVNKTHLKWSLSFKFLHSNHFHVIQWIAL